MDRIDKIPNTTNTQSGSSYRPGPAAGSDAREARRQALETLMKEFVPGDVVCWQTVNGLRYGEIVMDGEEKVVQMDSAHYFRLEDVAASPSFRKVQGFRKVTNNK